MRTALAQRRRRVHMRLRERERLAHRKRRNEATTEGERRQAQCFERRLISWMASKQATHLSEDQRAADEYHAEDDPSPRNIASRNVWRTRRNRVAQRVPQVGVSLGQRLVLDVVALQ